MALCHAVMVLRRRVVPARPDWTDCAVLAALARPVPASLRAVDWLRREPCWPARRRSRRGWHGRWARVPGGEDARARGVR